tara:strand:+ start:685 stop:1143 length:459 start_codon:yes stop_codon:yes gene_type:complete
MNIAAGVLLIIAAIFNVMAGCTYAVGGALAGGMGGIAEEMANDPEFQEAMEEAGGDTDFSGASEVKAAGAGLATWGFALFGIAGVMIGGAVCAFTKKKKGFVLVTGVLAIIAEGVGIVLIGFGIGNIVGLLAGLFVFLALKSFPSPASAAAA